MKIIGRFFLFLYRLTHIVYMLGLLTLVVSSFVFYHLLKTEKTVIPKKSVLIINLQGQLVEQRSVELFSKQNESYLREVVKALSLAEIDERVKAVVFNLNHFRGSSPASIAELLRAMEHFKASGKKLVSTSNYYGIGSYLIASVSDTIWLDPMGELALDGLATQSLYFKDAIDKVGLSVYVSRTGPFKSAVEPYLSNTMSEENRAVVNTYLQDSWQWMRQTLAKNRNLTQNEIENYVANRTKLLMVAEGDGAKLAKDKLLVDHLGTLDDLYSDLNTQLNNTLEEIDYLSYLKSSKQSRPKGKEIAIIYASGSIHNGEPSIGSISGEAVAKLITETAKKPEVAAIVIRVDSGGGDAYASELLYRSIIKVKESKPVLISMAGVAASGAYWLSLAANEVWAEETTLTGSIGVFSVFVSTHNLLSKYGVTNEGVATHPGAYPLLFVSQPTELALQKMDLGVQHTYTTFLNRLISAGRAINLEEANAKGEGRIYSGYTAKTLGLVDEIGGVNQVVHRAARLAEVDNFHTENYETTYSPFELVVEQLFAQSTLKIPYIKELAVLNSVVEQIYSPQTLLALEPTTLILN